MLRFNSKKNFWGRFQTGRENNFWISLELESLDMIPLSNKKKQEKETQSMIEIEKSDSPT